MSQPDKGSSGPTRNETSGECVSSPSSFLGLNYTVSPRASPKSVSIAPQPEVISPLILGSHKSVNCTELECDDTPRKPGSKILSSRRPAPRPPSMSSPSLRAVIPGVSNGVDTRYVSHIQYTQHQVDALVEQITHWIKDERIKQSQRDDQPNNANGLDDGAKTNDAASSRVDIGTARQLDLDKLEDILKQTLNLDRLPSRKSPISLRRKASIKKLQHKPSAFSSDTDYFEGGEHLVPSCDVLLDNSKTLAYTGGASDESDLSSGDELTRAASYRDQDAWAQFKFEIIRLAHTLRLKRWRKIPLEMSNSIGVQRLSGALTNAVYVVSPPEDLLPRYTRDTHDGTARKPRNLPPKLLLRIYGPQVEHLIDREAELAILRRLARKHIGPRLLGTFANGRFEEYFHAKALTPEDLRNPDTSRQIAKRMRELHDGIELLDHEREDGPFVWRNWDKWVLRAEEIVLWLDAQVQRLEPGVRPSGSEAWKRRGFICGVPWRKFREAVDKYRVWLYDQYGGSSKVREQLVFAHNDTQYGNILRLMPTGESPLLLPANTHKQLIVIDFEYSNSNPRGLEFANHFTEWCYDYHDKRKPYACNTNRYPTPEEQERFIRAYVRHRPQLNVSTPNLAPETPPSAPVTPGMRQKSTISEFMLDARAPPPANANASTQQLCLDGNTDSTAEDLEVARLMHETRIWRLANTAQWVAWGIVQAKVPGLTEISATNNVSEHEDYRKEDANGASEDPQIRARMAVESEKTLVDEQEEEFDYLGYAQHRAMFFWGDAIQLGIVDPHELPANILAKIKTVPH
ncbi:MAG: hypothetical protein FE78DRAFT_420283 [Acidomyces sp. 'richmondensis']|nr:MAG: hypothetical protein FE78DRAFT_420283 [Acidomyces sp. 'richmondensis']